MKKIASMICLLSSTLLVGCEAVAPALSKAVVAFGQNFINQASNNYAPEYANSVNNLLLTVAEIATGQPFTQTPANIDDGYDSDYSDEYDDSGYEYDEPSDVYDDQYDAEAGTADDSDYDYADSSEPEPFYSESGEEYGSEQPLALDVALLAQTKTPSGETLMRPIQDGEVLYGVVDDPVRGDKIKLHFKPNCDCYLYIIGIDATGWVTPMLPEPAQAITRLTANRSYLLPEGNEWWGLDEYQGVEHIYFIMTREQNLALEEVLDALPSERPAPPPDYQPVVQQELLSTRGMVKVQSAAPTSIPTQYGGDQMATADTFSTDVLQGDLVITRWFQHQ